MIDLDREAPVTLAESPKLIPAINAAPGMEARKPLHQRTVYNWATKGKRGIVLETVPVGGILVTTQQAIKRFFDRLATAREQRRIEQRELRENPIREATRPRTVRSRGKKYQEAMKRLAEEHGIICNGYQQDANKTTH